MRASQGRPMRSARLAAAAGAHEVEAGLGVERHRACRAVAVTKADQQLGRAVVAGDDLGARDDRVVEGRGRRELGGGGVHASGGSTNTTSLPSIRPRGRRMAKMCRFQPRICSIDGFQRLARQGARGERLQRLVGLAASRSGAGGRGWSWPPWLATGARSSTQTRGKVKRVSAIGPRLPPDMRAQRLQRRRLLRDDGPVGARADVDQEVAAARRHVVVERRSARRASYSPRRARRRCSRRRGRGRASHSHFCRAEVLRRRCIRRCGSRSAAAAAADGSPSVRAAAPSSA